MLYHIIMIIILAIFAIAVVVLFRKFSIVRKQRKEWELRETEFLNKLVSEGNLKPGQFPRLFDFNEGRTIDADVLKFKKGDNELGRDEIHALIFKEINQMSDAEIREFYQKVKEKQHGKQRKYDRKEFSMIVDYSVNDRYYRDFIQDISESGLFIKTPQMFSAGQKVKMTFMSPDYQKPFKIKGEIVRAHEDGVGVKFMMESQVQESALKSFLNNI